MAEGAGPRMKEQAQKVGDLPAGVWLAYREIKDDQGMVYRQSFSNADDPHTVIASDAAAIAAAELLMQSQGLPLPVRWEVRRWDDVRQISRFVATVDPTDGQWLLGELS